MAQRTAHIVLLFTLLSLISCKEGTIETNYGPSLDVANSHALAENAYSRVFNIFYRVVSDSVLIISGQRNINGAVCYYTEDPQITYTIDYDTSFNNCPDRILRKGRIIASMESSFRQEGTEAILSFHNYSFIENEGDTIRLDGNNSITYLGLEGGVFRTYEHIVYSGTLSVNDSLGADSMRWEATRQIAHIAGMDTPTNFNDDVFSLLGNANGSAREGAVFASYIIDTLFNYFDCRWIRQGSIELETPGLDIKNGYIYYIGEDECQSQIIYTFNGNEFYDDLHP